MSFEVNQNSQTGDSFVNDEQRQQYVEHKNPLTNSDMLGDQPNSYKDLKEKAIQLEKDLQHQEEQHKSQVIHTETIGMMTKYQLVFIKLETSLNKIDVIFKQRYSFKNFIFPRNNSNLNFAFDRVVCHRSMRKQVRLNRSKFLMLEIATRFQRANDIIRMRLLQEKEHALTKIWITFKIKSQRTRFAQEQEKIKKSFVSVIQSKDNETQSLGKKYQETFEALQQYKMKEQDLQQRIKQIEMMSAQMENELNNNRRNGGNDGRGSMRTIDQRVKFLEQENQEIQERIMTTEDSVNNFIKEMSELLDSHEISTNPDSDENMSYEHHQPSQEYQSQREAHPTFQQYNSSQSYNRQGNFNTLVPKQTPHTNNNRINSKNFYSNQLTRSNKLN